VEPAEPGQPLTVLAVCTGNICRSPAVERLLAHALGPDAGVRVASAGVRAVVGWAISDTMADLLTDAGAQCEGFAARQLTAAMVDDAALVLALTRAHRGLVVGLVPSAVRRTFTLREFARFAAAVGADALPKGSPAERLTALIPLAAAQRGQVPVDRRDDDVLDPYGGGDRLYALSFGRMRPAVDTISEVLRGRPW